MDRIILQTQVPRHESIRVQLSNDAYRSGIGAFITEGIPFTLRSSLSFAKKLATYIIRKYRVSEHNGPIHLCEFGSGTGLLANALLTFLQRYYPEIFNDTVIHISDYLPKTLESIQSSGVLDSFSSQVKFEHRNLTDFEFNKSEKPLLIYHTYLAQALPSHILLFDKGIVYELQVQTTVPKKMTLLNTATFPPEPFSGKDVVQLFKPGADIEKRTVLGWRIRDLLKEDLIPVNLSNSSLSKVHQDLIASYCKSIDQDQTFAFNFSPQLIDSMDIVKKYPETGLFMSDFGFTASNQIDGFSYDQLTRDYHQVAAHPVYFPILIHALNQSGLNHHITDHDAGHTQDFVIFSNTEKKHSSFFNKTFREVGDERIGPAVKVMEQSDNRKNIYEYHIKQFKTLTPDEKRDLYYLTMTATLLMTKGDMPEVKEPKAQTEIDQITEESLKLAEKAIKYYPELSASAYICQAMGRIKKHQWKAAMKSLDKAISIAPMLAFPYRLASLIMLHRKDYSSFIRYKSMEFQFSRENALECLFEICLIGTKMDRAQLSEEVLRYTIDMGNYLVYLTDGERKTLEKIKRFFLSPDKE